MNDKAMREAALAAIAVLESHGLFNTANDLKAALAVQRGAKPIYLVENGNKTFDIVDEYGYNDWPRKKRILYDAPVQSEAGPIGWVDPYTFKKMCEDVSGALRYVTKSPSDGDIPLFSGCEPHTPMGTDALTNKEIAEVWMDHPALNNSCEIIAFARALLAKRGES